MKKKTKQAVSAQCITCTRCMLQAKGNCYCQLDPKKAVRNALASHECKDYKLGPMHSVRWRKEQLKQLAIISLILYDEKQIIIDRGDEMTIVEFNSTAWYQNMFAMYNGHKYPVIAVDFFESLVALEGVTQGSDEPNWVRCENIELV